MIDRRHRRRRNTDRVHTELTVGIRKLGRKALLAYLLVIALAGYALREVQNQQDRAAIAACHRLNLVRAAGNESAYASWQFFGLVVHLTATNKARAKKAAEKFAGELAGYRAKLTWIPLVAPCSEAVDNPDTYQPPAPVRFDVRQPGKAALVVGHGE